MATQGKHHEPGIPAESGEAALEEVWADFYPALIRLFLNRGCDMETSEDLVQETLLRAFQSSRELRDKERLRSWVFSIALNTWRNHLRSSRSAKRASGEPVDPGLLDYLPADAAIGLGGGPAPDPLTNALDTELLRLVEKEIRKMPPQMRRSFQLMLAGHSYAEISQILATTRTSVASLLYQARQRLRTTAGRHANEARPLLADAQTLT